MISFLDETANKISKQFENQLSEIQIIVPNKRTGFHFRKSLAKSVSKTVWSPKIFTIQQYLNFITNFSTIDKLNLIFLLYKSFKKVDNKFDYDFDSFFNLANIILSDFNEIDSYLVEMKQIFTNIKNIHEIDYKYGGLSKEQIEIIQNYWRNFSPDNLSKEKEKFLELWNLLPKVYNNFTEYLRNNKIGYEGLLYRVLSEMILKKEVDTQKQTLFIGFNALNTAQKQLFKYLKSANKANFYWDNDKYYHNDKKQEAGDFLRANYKLLSEPVNDISYNFNSPNKKLNLFSVPGNVAQAKSIPSILKNYFDYDDILKNPQKTIIVLPEETMLFPVLYSIPEEIKQINISMGFPFKNTSLYNLLDIILKIQSNLYEKNKKSVFFKDVLSVLNHPLIYFKYKYKIDKFIDTINKKKLSYIGIDVLLSLNEKIFEKIFTKVEKSEYEKSLFTKLQNFLFILFTNNKQNKQKTQSIDNEFIYQAYITTKRLNEIIEKNKEDITLSFTIIINILKQHLSQARIPFESESTNGLQIMGLIETRNLDFDNIILLNANEGILPNLNRAPSLISESMRFAFNMPVLKFQDSIFGYFFYSLIQRAKNIAIVYNNLSGNNKSGELSRFVKQIELEADFKLNKIQLNQNLEINKENIIIIEKDKQILKIFDEYYKKDNRKKLTATAIGTYLSCSLHFYFKYIAKLKEQDSISEEFTPIELGNIIHFTMEIMYKDITNQNKSSIINNKDIERLKKNIDLYIELAFKKQYKIHKDKDFDFAGNLQIIKEVIKKHITNILKIDEKYSPFKIVNLEDENDFTTTIKINVNNNQKEVAIHGIIDRIDKKENTYRLVDYKTGNAKKEFKKLEELFLKDINKRKKEIFQLFFYGILLENKTNYSEKQIKPAIYDVRNMYNSKFEPYLKLKNGKELITIEKSNFSALLKDYKVEIIEIIEDIFNKDIVFSQTEEKNNCKYCPYQSICSL